MKIDRIDHLVLTVENIDRTCSFYESVLGFEVVTFGPGAQGAEVRNAETELARTRKRVRTEGPVAHAGGD